MLISRVRPGVLLEKASRRWLHSTLIAVDLPALERPTKQTSGALAAGSWSRRAAEVRKEARWRRDTTGLLGAVGFSPYCIIRRLQQWSRARSRLLPTASSGFRQAKLAEQVRYGFPGCAGRRGRHLRLDRAIVARSS